MAPLSTEASKGEGSPGPDSAASSAPSERVDRLVAIVVPVAVALILVAAGLAERGAPGRDLQILAPRHALEGQPVPVRVFLLDLRGAAPATVDGAQVDVVLRGVEGADQTAVVRARLEPSAAVGYEGSLVLPAGLTGTWQLFATARSGEEVDEARRRIVVGSAATPATHRGRLQTELQRYELGRVRGSAPPEHLEPRVMGGDCTNHAPCELVVWVGEPAASIRLEPGRGARESRCESEPTRGFVRCQVAVRGNEAAVDVIALRDGAEVGRRRLQLPMGSPAPALGRSRALVPIGYRPELTVSGLDEVYVVDLFHEGHWLHSAAMAPDPRGHLPIGWELDAPGLWRVQVRRDPFGSNGSAVATWWVSEEEPAAALAAFARHARQNDWLDPLASGLREGDLVCAPDALCGPERIATAMLAAGELEVLTYPRASSGAEQASAGVRTAQWGRRGLAAGLIFLAGLLVAFVVHRRASAAGRQARRILASAREEGEGPELRVRRDAVPAASAAFLVLVFGVVAAIVLARGCLIG